MAGSTIVKLDGATRRNWLRTAGLGVAGIGAAAIASGCAASGSAAMPRGAAALGAPTGPANMGSNENPFGPSPMAVAAMQKALTRVGRYANDETDAFRELVAKREGVSPEMVVVANGSSPILQAFGDMVAKKPGELVTSMATYESVPRSVQLAGGKVYYAPLTAGLAFDLDAMAARLGPNTAASYVCNPNNPTGNMVDPVKLKDFALTAEKYGPVFLDEAYLDLADDYEKSVMTGLVRDGKNVIVCRTFSKLYAMAGQRLGYAIAPVEIAKKMNFDVRQGGVNLLGLEAGMASLQDTAYQAEMRLRLKKGRLALVEMAKAAGRAYAPDPQANFIFMEVGMPNAEFAAKMAAEGVNVVRRSWPGYENWTRICVGTEEETARCYAATMKVFGV